MHAVGERITEFLRQGGDHRTNLQDPLVGAAEKADERFVGLLPQYP
jgi:hypothetical protein